MGYATGQFGKNHLGDLNQFLPTVHGFDEFFGYLYHLDAMEDPAHPGYPQDLLNRVGPRNMVHSWATDKDDPTVMPRWGKVGKQKIEDAGTLYPKRMETVDDEILAATLKFMDKAKADGKPFFVWLNPTRMHIVTHLSPKYEALRNSKNGWTIHEAGMAQLDDIVGDVMKKLKDLGVDDNTIVIFTTDNGTETFTWPDGGNTPFRGQKGTVFEGGFRVPALIRWPGKVPAGKVENGIFSSLDWLPTLVAAAGNPNIKDELLKGKKVGDRTYKNHLDGYNQMDLITGKGPSSSQRGLLLRREHSRRGAHRRLQVPLHRPASGLGWRQVPGRCAGPDEPAPRPVRASRLPGQRDPRRLAELLHLVPVRVLALRVRPAGSGQAGHDGHRVPAHAEGRELQPRCGEGEDRRKPCSITGSSRVTECSAHSLAMFRACHRRRRVLSTCATTCPS